MAEKPDPLSILEEAPESQNPVMVLYHEMNGKIASGNMPAAEYIALQKRVETALKEGSSQEERIATTLAFFKRVKARAGTHIPKGL